MRALVIAIALLWGAQAHALCSGLDADVGPMLVVFTRGQSVATEWVYVAWVPSLERSGDNKNQPDHWLYEIEDSAYVVEADEGIQGSFLAAEVRLRGVTSTLQCSERPDCHGLTWHISSLTFQCRLTAKMWLEDWYLHVAQPFAIWRKTVEIYGVVGAIQSTDKPLWWEGGSVGVRSAAGRATHIGPPLDTLYWFAIPWGSQHPGG